MFLRDVYKHRKLIIQLSKKDIKDKYLGSYLGVLWAFIQPTITILIFWFIFQVGFKSIPIDNFPFILWLVSGMIPWFFFSEALMSGTNSILEYRYLVKNVVFRVSLLPLIKILSSLLVHLFFIIFLIAMFLYYGYTPSVYNVQIFYYLGATIILVLGMTWLTSALVLFLKDIGQLLALLLQLGFWITPIFWSLKMVPSKYAVFIKLNPLYYLVEGYRNSLIFRSWFWEYPNQTIYFWIITLVILFIGGIVFKRLRPHFSDVI
jgi:ABC-type polysaccharide/polyol phosphate export permease